MTAPWTAPVSHGAEALSRAVAAAVPRLATARLTLRAPRLSDFAAYAEIVCSDRGIHIGGPLTEEEAWDDFCRATAVWLLRGHGIWAVEAHGGGDPLGFVLIGFEPGDQEPELGFLFRASAEGHGYAAEAAAVARDHAFGTLGLSTLVSYIAPGNARSVRVAERLGAVRDDGMVDGCFVYRHPALTERERP